jgi:formate hydrogenlyase transcriptional activator
LLVHFLLGKFAVRVGKHIESVSAVSMQRLAGYSWPGNVRELENVLERAVIHSQGPVLEVDPEMLPQAPAQPGVDARAAAVPSAEAAAQAHGSVPPEAPMRLEEIERAHIVEVLSRTGGVIEGERGAARLLALHPNTLRGRMKKLGIARAPRP